MGWFGRKSVAPANRPVAVNGAAAAATSPAGEARILELGAEMLERARKHRKGLLSAAFYSDALMNWSMKDPNFKVQLFRFVDAFPVLRGSEDTFDHLKDYLSQPGVTVPGPIALAMKAGGLAKGLAVSTISKQITSMAGKFIAGTDAASALGNLRELWDDGIAFSVDLLGEACVSDREADEYQAKYLDLISNLPASVASWPANERLERDHLGAIPRVNVSVKVSSLSPRCDPIDAEGARRDLLRRLLPILEAARARGVFVNFDMEQFALKDFTLDLFMHCCESVNFEAGLAMQAYLRSGPADARRIAEWSRRTGRAVSIRLVKGAYWDYEVINAEQRGWPCPVWANKRQTDACFETMTGILLDAAPRVAGEGGIKLALGSHNVRSIAAALAGAERRGLPHSAVELQMLHGMADQLKYAAAEMGLRIREYVPVGQMIPGMAYLVRRLLENTSNESWLKAGFLENAEPARLLASPHAPVGAEANPDSGGVALELGGRSSGINPERHNLSEAVEGVGDGRPFFNESFRDFSDGPTRERFRAAVQAARIPKVADVTAGEAAAMVEKAHQAFGAWRDADPLVRSRALVLAAQAMRDRRDELSGIMIKEAGKTWREADADTCEAIDFCEYYARQAVRLFRRQRVGRFIGELDETVYQPRGVAVVISPWNFPLAICCGMAVAALVTGNTVVVKPAEQTVGIARAMMDILAEAIVKAGVSRDLASQVLQLCPGPGETVGAGLVRHPRTALVAFTGSRDVGLDILHAAAPMSPFAPAEGGVRPEPLRHLKRVVCEMGGKNALIIDASADLDEAVLAVRHSAFGFQGQKCSACSRLIVVDAQGPDGPAITHFRERLIEASRAMTVGDPVHSGTDVGPIIDAEAQRKITGYIARAKRDGLSHAAIEVPAALGGTRDEHGGAVVTAPDGRTLHFVAPHVFWTVPPSHELAQEEVFGPVLAVMHAATFDDALHLANSLPYKLTGGVFSRKPSHIERAKNEFRVGNLYINRGITGALVARQPFGGFDMSGVGSKAGGADYLLQFVEPRAICENTMRRGFAPEL